MGTKTYECGKCGIMDFDMTMTEPEKKECPDCKSPLVRKFGATPSVWKTGGACGKIGK